MHAHKQLFDGWRVIHDIMWLWWISDRLVKSLSPTFRREPPKGHRTSTLPWELSPFKVNFLPIPGPDLLFVSKQNFFFFWIFKRWLPFIRFSWIYFFKAPGHKTDEFMIILAGVKKAESFVRRREITTSGRW